MTRGEICDIILLANKMFVNNQKGADMKRIDEEKLSEVYKYICDYHTSERKSPSYREIAAACNINSTAWVSSLLRVLEKRDLIKLEKQGTRHMISIPENLSVGASINASIVGSCPCGEPMLAVENIVSTVALPTEIFGGDEHFILKASGNSMIKRGIFDGDLMVVRVQNTAKVGDVVIARVDNEDATAKVLARDSKGVYYLKPANDTVDQNGKRVYKNIKPVGDWDILGVVDNVIHSPTKDVL